MFANAANWISAGSNSMQGIYSYVDTESISTQGKYKQSFIKTINIPKEFYMISLFSFDCKSNPKRTRISYLSKYDLSGNVITSGENPNQSFLPVIPDSIEEEIVNIICK